MEYLPLVIFVLGGVAMAYAAQYVIMFGVRNKAVRGMLAALYYGMSAAAAYLAIIWWQGVVEGKGGLWVIQHYFPTPGLMFNTALLAGNVVIAQVFWRMIIKRAGESVKERRRL